MVNFELPKFRKKILNVYTIMSYFLKLTNTIKIFSQNLTTNNSKNKFFKEILSSYIYFLIN